MIGLGRPFSARRASGTRELAAEKALAASLKKIGHVLNDPPPPGFYVSAVSFRDAESWATTRGIPDLSAQGRELAVMPGQLGKAAMSVGHTRAQQLARPSAECDTGPGPADGACFRLFDEPLKSDSAVEPALLSDGPGHTFAQADIGMRVAISSETGVQDLVSINDSMRTATARPLHVPQPPPAATSHSGSASARSGPRPASAVRPMSAGAGLPLQRTKLFSSIAPASERGVSFATAPSARLTVGSRIGMFRPASATQSVPALQNAGNDLIGLRPGGIVGVSAPAPRTTSFAATPRGTDETAGLGLRELMRLHERRQPQALRQRRATTADLQARREEAAAKKRARAERLREKMAERDALFAEKSRDRVLAAPLARRNEDGDDSAEEQDLQIVPEVKGSSAEEENSGSGVKTTSAAAMAAAQKLASEAAAASKKQSAIVLPPSSGSSSSDSEEGLSLQARRDRRLRASLQPSESYSPRAKAARLAAQARKREQRARHVAQAVQGGVAAHKQAEEQKARLVALAAERAATAAAVGGKDSQKVWLTLIAHLTRVARLRDNLTVGRTLRSLDLNLRGGALLARRVGEAVLRARDQWKALVRRRRQDRAARVIQRTIRRVGLRLRLKRARHANSVLVSFFLGMGERARVAKAIVSFRGKIVRLQRWWRRTGVPILRARATLLERLWSRTLLLRWEELLKFRSYMFHALVDAANGRLVALRDGMSGGGASSFELFVPPEERQRFVNLAVVWRAGEEEARSTCMLPSPTPAMHALVEEGKAALAVHAASAVASGASPGPSDAPSSHPSTGRSHSGASGGAVHSALSLFHADVAWEGFVCALMLRGDALTSSGAVRGSSLSWRRPSVSTHGGGGPSVGLTSPSNRRGGLRSPSLSAAHGRSGSSGGDLNVSFRDVVLEATSSSAASTAAAASLTHHRTPSFTRRGSVHARKPTFTFGGASTGNAVASHSEALVRSALDQACLFGGFSAAVSGWTGPGVPYERAQAEFETFIGIAKQPASKESNAGTAAASATTNPNATSAGAATMTNSTATPVPLRDDESAVNAAGVAGTASGADTAATPSAAPSAPPAAPPPPVSITAQAASIRRTILRNLYLRLRLQHRKLIYQKRAFSIDSTATKSHRHAASHAAPFAAAVSNAGGSSSRRTASFAQSARGVTGVGSSSSSPFASVIDDSSVLLHWRAHAGLSPSLSRRWIHLLSVSLVQSCMMEAMVPRALSAWFAQGVLMGASVPDDFAKLLLHHRGHPSLQLPPHREWPLLWQSYGMQARPLPPLPPPQTVAPTPPMNNRPTSGSARRRLQQHTGQAAQGEHARRPSTAGAAGTAASASMRSSQAHADGGRRS